MIFQFLMGTAFVANGYIFFTHHSLANNMNQTLEVVSNTEKDIAYSKTNIESKISAECTDLKEGDEVYIIGYPKLNGAQILSESSGKIQRRVLTSEGKERWQVDSKIWYGYSGSPVFDSRGVVVGVVTDMSLLDNTALFSDMCGIMQS